mgnify:CR=1 FL=1
MQCCTKAKQACWSDHGHQTAAHTPSLLHPPPGRPLLLRRLPRLLQLAAKAAFQLLSLLWLLLVALPRPDVILLQLPPALPTMLVCRAAAARHRARLVFDWHNFAYTLMAIGMSRGHPVVSPGARPERRRVLPLQGCRAPRCPRLLLADPPAAVAHPTPPNPGTRLPALLPLPRCA